jgi:hypothetical protein
MGHERVRRRRDAPSKQVERSTTRGGDPNHEAVLDLQRRAGNRATTALLRKPDGEQGGSVKDKIRFFEQLATNGGSDPKTEQPKLQEPKSEEPVVQEPKTEQPVVQEPKTEEPVVEEPKAVELPPEPKRAVYANPKKAGFKIGARGIMVNSDDEADLAKALDARVKVLKKASYKLNSTVERVVKEQFGFDPLTHRWTLDQASQAVEYLETPYAQSFEERWAPKHEDESTQPFVFEIEGELVRCPTDEDKQEAEQIAKRIKAKHGITLSGAALVEANEVVHGKDWTQRDVRVAAWELRELRALETGLAHVGAITGETRESSGLAGVAQGVLYIGRTNTAGDGKGVGEFFGRDAGTRDTVDEHNKSKYGEGRPVIGIYNAVRKPTEQMPMPQYVPKGTSEGEQGQRIIEGLIVHELGHALFQPVKIGEWTKKFGWESYTNRVGRDVIEPPPTLYGTTSAGEDMAESFALYFVNHDLLAKVAPERERFIAQWVSSWTPEKVEEFGEGALSSTGGHKR